jgi:hypothetical protein
MAPDRSSARPSAPLDFPRVQPADLVLEVEGVGEGGGAPQDVTQFLTQLLFGEAGVGAVTQTLFVGGCHGAGLPDESEQGYTNDHQKCTARSADDTP